MRRPTPFLVIICLTYLLASFLVCAADPKERVRDVLTGKDSAALSQVSEFEKSTVVAELKRYASEKNGAYARPAIRELVKLGDRETIQMQIDSFINASSLRRAHAAAIVLMFSDDAGVIPQVAQDLSRDEPATEVHDKVSFEYPRSIQAAGIIVAIGAKSPELPEQVRQSLKALEHLQPGDRRSILRRWWTSNQDHFVAKDYQKIAPAK